jgi:hypothetical protein
MEKPKCPYCGQEMYIAEVDTGAGWLHYLRCDEDCIDSLDILERDNYNGKGG